MRNQPGQPTFETQLWFVSCVGLIALSAVGFGTATWVVFKAWREVDTTNRI